MKYSKMNIWRLIKGGALALLLVLVSCKGDDIVVNTDKNRVLGGALPAIKFKYSVADGLKELDKEELYADETGLVFIEVTQDVSIAWDDLALIKDVSENWTYNMADIITSTPVAPLKSSGTFSIQEKIKLNSDAEVSYDHGTLKSGDLEISINLPLGFAGPVTVSIPEATPVITTTFNADGVLNSFYEEISLADHDVVFHQGVDSSYVTLNIDASLTHGGVPAGQMAVDLNLKDIKTKILYGYFGQKQNLLVDEAKSINDIDEDIDFSKFELKEISYTLRTDNHMGVPFKIDASNIRFSKMVNDAIVTEQLLVEGNSLIHIDVEPAKIGPPLQPSKNDYVVDKDNSNIIEVSNPLPDTIMVNILATANPAGKLGVQNFIGEVDSLYAYLDIKAPLWAKVNQYTRTDTIDFDFRKMMEQKSENAELIDEVDMHIDFYNKLPFQAEANLFVADADGNKIQDLLVGYKSILSVGKVDEIGKVTTPEHTHVLIELSSTDIMKFFNQSAKFLILETRASSANNGTEFAKVYEDATLEGTISLEASGRVPEF